MLPDLRGLSSIWQFPACSFIGEDQASKNNYSWTCCKMNDAVFFTVSIISTMITAEDFQISRRITLCDTVYNMICNSGDVSSQK